MFQKFILFSTYITKRQMVFMVRYKHQLYFLEKNHNNNFQHWDFGHIHKLLRHIFIGEKSFHSMCLMEVPTYVPTLLGEFSLELSIIVLHYMTQGLDFCHNFFTQFKCNDEYICSQVQNILSNGFWLSGNWIWLPGNSTWNFTRFT